MPGEREVDGALRHVLEGAWVMKEEEAKRTVIPREARHQLRKMLGPLLPHERRAHDLDRPGRCVHHRSLIDEQASARSLERWITGPSAIGSEKGTPSSITSAPAFASACITGTASFGSGSPAVTKGIRAFLPCFFNFANVSAMRDISNTVMSDE